MRASAVATTIVIAVLGCPCVLLAQPGDGSSALPGLLDVTVPDIGPPRLALALSGGYGVIEPIRASDGEHHRAYGSVGISVRPWDYISAWVRFDGRYDAHPDDGMGGDESLVGDPRFGIRGAFDLGDGLRLGADLGFWLPGAEAPSVVGDALGFTAMGLGSWTIDDSGLTLALNAGFRFDQSSATVTNPSALRVGDQISLGASDFHAVVLGAGASYRGGDAEVFGELGWSVLIDAPDALTSPIHLGLGGRFFLPAGFALEVNARVGLSSRLDPTTSGVLVPIEPRFSVGLGLRYAFQFDGGDPNEIGEPDDPDDPDDPELDIPDGAVISGVILDEAGQPLANATIEVEGPDGFSATVRTDANGRFTITDAPEGAELTLRVDAEGFARRELTASTGAPVELALERRVPSGALRGLVRDYRGRPVAATITVTPGDAEATTDTDGVFEIELPVGSYEVVIGARGMREQRRSVEVEDNGVTILNADLRRARGR